MSQTETTEPRVDEAVASAQAERLVAAPVVVAAQGLSKLYPRPRKARGLVGWINSRLTSAEDVQDEDDDLDDDDEAPEDGGHAAGWVVRGVDLELRAGSSTGIVGPAGGGKTTLAELLAGLVPPTEGRIALAGRVVPVLDNLPKLMQDNDVKRNVVLLARILGLPRSWAMERRPGIIAFAGLTGSERRLRKQMTTAELQRLAVSTMLEVDGVAYLVDSTIGGRDRDFRARCLERLEERRRAGAAIVHIERELEGPAGLCDELLWLERGQILVRGKPDEIAEAITQRRAGARRTGAPTATAKAAQFVRFLRVAIGDLRATEALHAAEELVRSAGEDQVDWADVASSAGYDVSEAKRIVDRLARTSDGLFEEEQRPEPTSPPP
jgi:ABC-type polysaccharide/polyol phosphate transport system ATPase subunit